MFTKQEVRTNANRWGWTILRYLFIGLFISFTYLGIADFYFNPVPLSTLSNRIGIGMLTIVMTFFAVGIGLACRVKTICPACRRNLGGHVLRVRLTRRCTYCREQIVEGKIVSNEVLRRHSNLQRQKFLWLAEVSLWCWPTISIVILISGIAHLARGQHILHLETDRKLDLSVILCSSIGILFAALAFKQYRGWTESIALFVSTLTLAIAALHFLYITSPTW